MTRLQDIHVREAAESDWQRVDQLLWDVLWRPIGLPRDIREQFRRSEQEVVLVAEDRGVIVGAVVGQAIDDRQMELRHLAVRDSHQLKGIGCTLVATFLRVCCERGCYSVCTHARNTSLAFFEKQGFGAVAGQVLSHPDFAEHGIHFQLMRHSLDSGPDVGQRPRE